MNGKLTK